MNEIKFRVWDKKRKKIWYPEDMCRGEMVDPKNCGNLVYCDIDQIAVGADGTLYILDQCGNWEYPENLNESYELMFYTGYKDKNGEEIYEDDIVKWIPGFKEGATLFGEVGYEGDGFFVADITNCSDIDFYDIYDGTKYFEWDELEVVGNIYENSELSKDG